MATTDFIAAIELGSSKIAGIAGKKNSDGSIQVLAYAREDSSSFIRKGVIYNLDKTAQSLTSIINKLEGALNNSIAKIYVGIGGQSLRTVRNVVSRDLEEETIISQELVDSICDENLEIPLIDMDILDVAPQEYKIGNNLQADPVGVAGSHIEGRFLNIVARASLKKNLERCFEQAKIEIADLLISPLVTADAVLTESERRSGCALIDFGADTSTISIYKNNILRFLTVLPLGGNSITHDLVSLQMEEEEAERLKIRYGNAFYEEEEGEEPATCQLEDGNRTIELGKLNNIIEARTEEIIANVWNQIQLSGYDDKLLAGLIITGGAANLKDLDEVLRKRSKIEKVRNTRFVRNTIHADEDVVKKDGTQNTLFGLLIAGNENCCLLETPAPQPHIQPQPQPEPVNMFEEDESLKEQEAAARAAKKKKEEEEEVLGATKPILSDDIRKLMEQLENGEEPEITDEDAEDFVDDEEDEATESPEDSSKEASDTDEEDPEENDFEEIVDSEEDDESDAVYDEEAEYEDEDDSEYDDDEEYEDEDDSEYDDDEEYEDEDDSEYDDEEEYEDEDEDDYQIDDELDEDHKEDFDFEKESALDIDDHDSDEDDGDFADLDSFEDEEELDSSDYYLDPEFDEKPAPEPEKETSKSAQTPDIDEVLEIEEPSEDEITERMGKFDTGFVVQGRYDLSATSEIGLKLGLTEEQKQLFSYFVPIRGVSEQLVEILDNDKRCRNRYGTSRTGNILILGRKGSGKTVLAVDIVKAIQKQRRLKQGKVAIVTGDSLNKKDIGSIIDKLNGGALIIEKASKMNDRTIRELNDMMDEQTGELLFLLEDQKKPLERMFASHREFKRKFTSRLELPVFINDELVTFGQTYAKENGYRIDEMGILALYSRIDMMQREDHAVTVAEVKEIMDEAISHSQKANVKHLVKRVFGRSTDNSDHIILKEEDFKA